MIDDKMIDHTMKNILGILLNKTDIYLSNKIVLK